MTRVASRLIDGLGRYDGGDGSDGTRRGRRHEQSARLSHEGVHLGSRLEEGDGREELESESFPERGRGSREGIREREPSEVDRVDGLMPKVQQAR